MTDCVQPAGIMTGLSDFDAFAGPLPSGQVTAAVGCASSGMTAFALSVARHNDEVGHQVAFASFESGTDSITGNLVAARTSVNTDRMLSINSGRRSRIDRAREAMDRSNLLLWSSAQSPGRPFMTLMEHMNARPDLQLLVVDGYSQASYEEPSEGETFAALEQFAREHAVAVLVTAHLNADHDLPATEPLTLADLSPFERAVAKAPTAVILHRPDRYGTVPERRDEVDLTAAHGWSDTGTATVRFEPAYHRFVDLPNT